MDMQVFTGLFLTELILIPTLLYSLLPLRNHLRYSPGRTAASAFVSVATVIAVFTLIGTGSGIPFKWLIFMSLLPCLAINMWLTEGKVSMRLFCFFNATMITGNGILYGMIVAAPYERDGSYLTMSALTALICLGATLILGAIYFKTLSRDIPYLLASEPLRFNYSLGLSITIFITLLFFWVMPKYATVIMTGRVRTTILAFLLLGPGAFLLVYHAMWRVAVNLTENAELRESNELMVMEQKRYEELRTYMDETRAMRHDFRQHLLVIDDYAKKNETEKLRDYIGQFTESLSEHRSIIAANPALDAVASHYESLAESGNTQINWMIELPSVLPVKESDFITVFGNLIENALTAVSRLPEDKRIIHVHTRMLSERMLGLTVKNPYEGVIKLNKNGLPGNDSPGHGIGLASVSAVVGRYNGSFDISTVDGIFTAGVLLYLKETK